MAGFFSKLNGYVYDGTHKAGEALANGQFVEIVDGVVTAIAEAKGPTMVVADKTVYLGKPALVLNVTNEGEDAVYMTETAPDGIGNVDPATFAVPVGGFVKMRQPARNDQLIINVSDAVYAAVDIGDTVQPAAGGTVAKV